jgi:hypothetical protein
VEQHLPYIIRAAYQIDRDLIVCGFVVTDKIHLVSTVGEPAEVIEVGGCDPHLYRERM